MDDLHLNILSIYHGKCINKQGGRPSFCYPSESLMESELLGHEKETRSPRTSGSSRQPTGIWRKWSAPITFVKISGSTSMSSPSLCPRCATGCRSLGYSMGVWADAGLLVETPFQRRRWCCHCTMYDVSFFDRKAETP